MKINSSLHIWLLAVGCVAIPRPVVKQHVMTPIEYFKDDPYTREWRNPYDKKIDSVAEDLHPLPFRNGDGASILGPQNKDRQKQNPDLIRPPSTDHGDMKNMRWSFADSHVRIEVCHHFPSLDMSLTLIRKAAGHAKPLPASSPPAYSLQGSTCVWIPA
jgi:hypothetical protein